ncbi:Rne/Rng family ribonuclease [Sandaracinobacteroides sp. A072]|uniref:Rne/Rng family ribonuclease n=1 Tax=Sandaracinobacteroides sp. A072 TaxID=3461146 RepID=UPI0040422786
MTTRMLIDARHPEETRVAVVKGNRIEEFDFEAAARKQIKGNIYLAKITRVEPSLQAAFVDYGGNRHGFLAFSEIHPDYYQIPKEDRDALLREEQELVEEAAAGDFDADDDGGERPAYDRAAGDGVSDNGAGDSGADGGSSDGGEPAARPEEHGNAEEAGAEALRRRRMALRRRYKIQEVIRRRQVMLVQVVKEERGNKGAALTTYISLAGRYSVLMPNTAQGGGISRKIANAADRKRLKTIMAELNLPSSMGAIVRTAGLERTKTEIKRDFDYLARLWDEIREKTLTSTAPALIYEDSDLVKRAIRDIYTREIDEVLVDGQEGYAQAKSFMKLLMPSHAKKVQLYADPVPLFHRAAVESQLAALLNPVVTLRSGGYIVINPTEALVAIDVNSGRSTREYNIEETALKTNIEAAEEVARQLRLRDLAGLVVVDFIDMESNSNNRKVERALKDALKHDRARIQVGRISPFGLLEMSRQRLRTGVLEASTQVCPMCDGSGLIRTDGSAALAALRLLEEEAVKGRASVFRLRADRSVAVYMLNRKRLELAELEARYAVLIEVLPDESLIGGRMQIDSSGPPPAQAPRMAALAAPRHVEPDPEEAFEELDEEEEAEVAEGRDAGRDSDRDGQDERGERRGRRRRGRRARGGRDRDRDETREESGEAERATSDAPATGEDSADVGEGDVETVARDGQEERGDRRGRRGRRRRGGRRGRNGDAVVEGHDDAGEAVLGEAAVADADEATLPAAEDVVAPAVVAEAEVAEDAAVVAGVSGEESAEKPKRTRRRPAARARAAADTDAGTADMTAAPVAAEVAATDTAATDTAAAEAPKPARKRRTRATAPAKTEAATEVAASEPAPRPKRTRKPRAAAPDATLEAAPEAAAEAGVEPAVQVEAAPVGETVATPQAEEAKAEEAKVGEVTPEAEPAEPPRRGWWQRTFGE